MKNSKSEPGYVQVTVEQPIVFYGVAELEAQYTPIFIDGHGVPCRKLTFVLTYQHCIETDKTLGTLIFKYDSGFKDALYLEQDWTTFDLKTLKHKSEKDLIRLMEKGKGEGSNLDHPFFLMGYCFLFRFLMS